MLDASAFKVAGFDPVGPVDGAPLPLGKTDRKQDDSAAALALAGCAACQQAIGDCAVHYAKTGAISPGFAISICSSMQRLTQRAFAVRAATLSGYSLMSCSVPAGN